MNTLPAGPWETYGQNFIRGFQVNGHSNFGWGTVSTQNQIVSGQLQLTPYQFNGNDPQYDYFAFNGSFQHGVTNYADNAVSVGYYARKMVLDVQILEAGKGPSIIEHAPNTTVKNVTTSFQIGGSLSGEFSQDSSGPGGSIGAGVSASFGFSVSAPDTLIEVSTRFDGIRWTITLPARGFIDGAGNPANPFGTSRSGFTTPMAMIIRVPKGQPAALRLTPSISWAFDWTRGIIADQIRWHESYVYEFEGKRVPA